MGGVVTPAELVERRKALHLTQFALAVRLGVRPQSVNRWERGKQPIPAWLDLALKGLEMEPRRGSQDDD